MLGVVLAKVEAMPSCCCCSHNQCVGQGQGLEKRSDARRGGAGHAACGVWRVWCVVV